MLFRKEPTMTCVNGSLGPHTFHASGASTCTVTAQLFWMNCFTHQALQSFALAAPTQCRVIAEKAQPFTAPSCVLSCSCLNSERSQLVAFCAHVNEAKWLLDQPTYNGEHYTLGLCMAMIFSLYSDYVNFECQDVLFIQNYFFCLYSFFHSR